jgi:hypothetical protein
MDTPGNIVMLVMTGLNALWTYHNREILLEILRKLKK